MPGAKTEQNLMQSLLQTGILVLLIISSGVASADELPVKQFLRFIYGAEPGEISRICLASDDTWMLRGAKNTNALSAIDALSIDPQKRSGCYFGLIQNEAYFIELRDGKVDPAFSLEGQYSVHRQLVKTLLYAALRHDQRLLSRLTTNPQSVEVSGPKDAPPPGDMDVYEGVIQAIPVVRTSKPSEDAKSKTVTYRVPIGEEGLNVPLLKQGGIWKIDTSKPLKISLAFFYQ